MKSNAEYLGAVPLFAPLRPADREAIGNLCVRKVLAAGETLFREGEPGLMLVVVLRGTLRVEKLGADGNTHTLARRGPGEVVGEMAVIDGEPRSATVVAQSEVRVLCLYQDVLERYLLSQSTVAVNLLKGVVARLRDADAIRVSERSQSVPVRLLAHLRARAEDSGLVEGLESQRLLASGLGCNRETLNRALQQLISEGRVERLGPRTLRVR